MSNSFKVGLMDIAKQFEDLEILEVNGLLVYCKYQDYSVSFDFTAENTWLQKVITKSGETHKMEPELVQRALIQFGKEAMKEADQYKEKHPNILQFPER